MKKLIIALTLIAAASLAGCGEPSVADSCATFCEQNGACSGDSADEIADCREQCAADIEPADADCQSSFAAFADCFSEASCQELTDGDTCGQQMQVFLDDCAAFLSE